MYKLIALSILLVGGVGCGLGIDTEKSGRAVVDSSEQAYIEGLTPEAREGTVAFLNDPGTTVEVLDEVCGLHSDAAKHLIRHRDGQGRTEPNPFDDLYEAAAVTEVGTWNLQQAEACARDHGFIPDSFLFDATSAAPLIDSAVERRIERDASGLWDACQAVFNYEQFTDDWSKRKCLGYFERHLHEAVENHVATQYGTEFSSKSAAQGFVDLVARDLLDANFDDWIWFYGEYILIASL